MNQKLCLRLESSENPKTHQKNALNDYSIEVSSATKSCPTGN